MMEYRDLLSSILHLRFSFAQGAPHALRRERRLAYANASSSIDCVGDISRHGIKRCLTASLGAVRTYTILVLNEVKFDLSLQV